MANGQDNRHALIVKSKMHCSGFVHIALISVGIRWKLLLQTMPHSSLVRGMKNKFCNNSVEKIATLDVHCVTFCSSNEPSWLTLTRINDHNDYIVECSLKNVSSIVSSFDSFYQNLLNYINYCVITLRDHKLVIFTGAWPAKNPKEVATFFNAKPLVTIGLRNHHYFYIDRILEVSN